MRHPYVQQPDSILEKLRKFHHDHQTPLDRVLANLETAVEQLPYNTCGREAVVGQSEAEPLNYVATPPNPSQASDPLRHNWLQSDAPQHAGATMTNLSALAGLTTLKTLNLVNTPVSDLSSLVGLTSLKNLELTSTQVSDLSPLVGLTSLKRLALGATPVSDLSPLAGLTNLTKLGLKHTLVSDVTPLGALKPLEIIDLNWTRTSDVSPLAGLINLKGLYLSKTPLSQESVRQLKTALPRCTVDFR